MILQWCLCDSNQPMGRGLLVAALEKLNLRKIDNQFTVELGGGSLFNYACPVKCDKYEFPKVWVIHPESLLEQKVSWFILEVTKLCSLDRRAILSLSNSSCSASDLSSRELKIASRSHRRVFINSRECSPRLSGKVAIERYGRKSTPWNCTRISYWPFY